MSNHVFSATATLIDQLKTECTSRDFSLVMDEPCKRGNESSGMTPLEALLSAIGACKCIAAKSFAKSQKIDLIDIKIELDGEIDTDGFYGINKEAKMGFHKITSKYYIQANNSDKEIKEFVNFVERTCPVLDTIINAPELSNEINIIKK
ncbi:OsmC family protein [Alcaligenes faecalis]|uniref:OsmC family protein n=1 Tax=Alcaligenes faecalis TaxID=511 RepID=UPI001C8373B7|nr:OsmC family protein [Alcaligenes faecalis]MBX6963088.1 OsmC family peroxiredoxin [Providencia rettgeri]MBX7029738.1 OsmC family peroxiredoxin [Alcaligenes faecalis]